jgi:hypothetical protein
MLFSRRRACGVATALAVVIASHTAAAEEPHALGPSSAQATPPVLAPEAPEVTVPSNGTSLLTAGLVTGVIGANFLAGGSLAFSQSNCSQCPPLPLGFSVGSMVLGGGLLVSGVIMAAVGGARMHAAREQARSFVAPAARGLVVRF